MHMLLYLMLSAHNNLSCWCTVGSRCLHKCLIRFRLWKKAGDGIAWWKTQMTYQISLMNWSIYWNKLNWRKGSQRSRKLFSYGWKPSRSYSTYELPGLFILHIRLVKMCWQPLFIPLNKSGYFSLSELKCLLINLGQKQKHMQLLKWMNLIPSLLNWSCLCWNLNDISEEILFVYLSVLQGKPLHFTSGIRFMLNHMLKNVKDAIPFLFLCERGLFKVTFNNLFSASRIWSSL